MLDLVDNLVESATETIRSVVLLMAVIMVITVWFKTKSFAPTLGAIIFSAIVVWGVFNTSTIGNSFGDQIEEDGGEDINVEEIDLTG